MNCAASAGVHRCRSAVSGVSGSTPLHGFQLILRSRTAALSATRSVAKTRSRVVGPHVRLTRTSPSIFTDIAATRRPASSALSRPMVANNFST